MQPASRFFIRAPSFIVPTFTKNVKVGQPRENRLKQVDTAQYNYDAFGNRTMQYVPPVYNEYVVDLSGRAITAIKPGSSVVYTAEVFAGGRHWTTDNGSALFLGADWVGTSRALTNLSGTFDQLYTTSSPWGDGLSYTGGSNLLTTSQFTGKEYDAESNLYHFPFRQYAPIQGRWLTPDPAGLAAVDPSNPQTWNRYAYVVNNPLSNVDPLGLAGDCGWKCKVSTIQHDLNNDIPFFPSVGFNCEIDGTAAPCYVAYGLEASGAGVSCPQCQPGQTVGMDNVIYAVATDFFQKDCSGPVSGGVAGAFGNCTTTFVGTGILPVGTVSGAPFGLFGGVLYPGMNGPFQALANAAKTFGKVPKPDPGTLLEDPWADNQPLDWETDFMSEETKMIKSALDGAADFFDGILSGGNGLSINFFMISPAVMGCAGYGNLPCANGRPTHF